MFVVKMTQRATEPTEQNLQALQQDFAQRLGADFPVTRAADPTVYHSAVESSQQVVAMALHAMRLGLWHVGIGVGGAAENGTASLKVQGLRPPTWRCRWLRNKDNWCRCVLRLPSRPVA